METTLLFAFKSTVPKNVQQTIVSTISSWGGVQWVAAYSPDADPDTRSSRLYFVCLKPEVTAEQMIAQLTALPEIHTAEEPVDRHAYED